MNLQHVSLRPSALRIVWQTPLARQWMQKYFALQESAAHAETPAPLAAWLAGGAATPLTISKAFSRLVFSLADGGNEQWMIVLREESDDARVQALMALFRLTQRESEVLHWLMMGKTNRDIGDILGTSPRTVNKHLENLFRKLGVETRTAAATLALNRLRGALPEGAASVFTDA